MLNKLILYRFFFRKNQDSSTDFYLPMLFMFVVSLSTILIFISSLQLFDFEKKKEYFLSNKWNHVYDLFVGNSKFDYNLNEFYEFESFKDSMENLNSLDLFKFYKSKKDFPQMVHLSSSEMDNQPLVLTYLFDSKDEKLFSIAYNDTSMSTDPVIFLNDKLMDRLKVKENDYVLLKRSRSNGYKALLKVKQISGDTRIKSYIFNNYKNSTDNLVRFYFSNLDTAFKFIKDCYLNDFLTPFTIGSVADGGSFLSIIDKKFDYISGIKVDRVKNKDLNIKKNDIITHINGNKIFDLHDFKKHVNQTDNNKIALTIVRGRGKGKATEKSKSPKESISIDIINKDETKDMYKKIGLSLSYYEDNVLIRTQNLKNRNVSNLQKSSVKIKNNTNVKTIPYQGVIDNPDGTYTIQEARIFIDYQSWKNYNQLEIPGLSEKFYIEIDLYKNLQYKNNGLSEETDLTQLQILNFFNQADSISFHQYISGKNRYDDKRYFMYAENLDNDITNLAVMEKLNSMNIRWDNARWKTIINLNQSLDEGKKNITMLMIANFLVFLLVLIIKFLLRLKLELHTIGVLKCFGYPRKIIFSTYNLGNLIIILLGSLIGYLPIGFCMARILGYSSNKIFEFYLSAYSIYNIIFIVSIIIVSIITTTFFLFRYTEKENIYELIKYEG